VNLAAVPLAIYLYDHESKALTNSSLSTLWAIERNNTGSSGTTIGFVLDLGAFDLSNGSEEFHQILIASRPRKLGGVSKVILATVLQSDLHCGHR
jgi:hypothetical protein